MIDYSGQKIRVITAEDLIIFKLKAGSPERCRCPPAPGREHIPLIPPLKTVRFILRALGKPESLITFVKDHPGHDRRYAIDATRLISEMGWRPQNTFVQGLHETIRWYCENQGWWRRIKSDEYRAYYAKTYDSRLCAAAAKNCPFGQDSTAVT